VNNIGCNFKDCHPKLKGQCHEIFYFRLFHGSSSFGPPDYPGWAFSIFYIKFADTGGKFADGVIAITIDLWKGVTTGVIDISCKFANSANDAGGTFASSAHLELPNF
jgi:hypothetical protein